MKTTLHMAVSIDGFVADKDGDSSWVSDIDERLFAQRCAEAGCVIIGRSTYQQYSGLIYPVQGTVNIVLSGHLAEASASAVHSAASPQEALAHAEELRFEHVLIAGGAKTAASFLCANLLDEIFLSVHPIGLGNGLSLFANCPNKAKLALLGTKELGAELVQLHYRVARSHN